VLAKDYLQYGARNQASWPSVREISAWRQSDGERRRSLQVKLIDWRQRLGKAWLLLQDGTVATISALGVEY